MSLQNLLLMKLSRSICLPAKLSKDFTFCWWIYLGLLPWWQSWGFCQLYFSLLAVVQQKELKVAVRTSWLKCCSAQLPGQPLAACSLRRENTWQIAACTQPRSQLSYKAAQLQCCCHVYPWDITRLAGSTGGERGRGGECLGNERDWLL